MKPAVFLDRDGVLTVEKGYITVPSETEIYVRATESINMLHNKGYLCIVVTNQSGIARGLFSEKDLLVFNERLKVVTALDAIYYCPHYSAGMISKYSIKCNCRKPSTGMIDRACIEYDIDIRNSWMVGDREVDVLTGINANLKSVLIGENDDVQRRYGIQCFSELYEFAKYVNCVKN